MGKRMKDMDKIPLKMYTNVRYMKRLSTSFISH